MPQKLIYFCIGFPQQGFGGGSYRGGFCAEMPEASAVPNGAKSGGCGRDPTPARAEPPLPLPRLLRAALSQPALQGGSASFSTRFLFPTYLEKNCYFLYFLKAVPLSFWHFKVFVLFYLPHLVMTSAFGRMPLTPQPFSPAVSHHNFALNWLLIGLGHLLCSVVPLNNLHTTYNHFILLTGPFSFLLTSLLALRYFPFWNHLSLHWRFWLLQGCKFPDVHTYREFCTELCTIPRRKSKVRPSLCMPWADPSQKCHSWCVRGLGGQASPIVFPTLKLHTVYYSTLFPMFLGSISSLRKWSNTTRGGGCPSLCVRGV